MAMHNFDQFADDYVKINDQFSSFFREDTTYFARYKASYVARLVGTNFAGKILDFGCGIGLVSNRLHELLPAAHVDGIDSSQASITRARTDTDGGPKVRYFDSEADLDREYDVIIMANVLHHVPPGDRQSVLAHVFSLLGATGAVVVFEHNTWNPLVMRIVKKHPFDQDAAFLSPMETARLVRAAGFSVRTDFIVFFPSFLKSLRRLEPRLRYLPIGGQYACVGRKGA